MIIDIIQDKTSVKAITTKHWLNIAHCLYTDLVLNGNEHSQIIALII